jgi:hypothetical protein
VCEEGQRSLLVRVVPADPPERELANVSSRRRQLRDRAIERAAQKNGSQKSQ